MKKYIQILILIVNVLPIKLYADWELSITASDIDNIGANHTISLGYCEECTDGWRYGEDQYDYPNPPSLEYTNINFTRIEWFGQSDLNGNICTDWKFSTDYRSTHQSSGLTNWEITGSTGNGLSEDIPIELYWNSDMVNTLSEEYELFIFIGDNNYNMREINSLVVDQSDLYNTDDNNANIKVVLGACAQTGTTVHFLDSDGDGWGGIIELEYCPGMAPDGWVENNLDLNDDIYCESNELDCQGTLCGNVITDECGICGGSGIPEGDCDCYGNKLDCNNVCGGTSVIANVCSDIDGDGLGTPNTNIDQCIELSDRNNLLIDTDGNIFYNANEPIYGFQFELIGSNVLSAYGGAAEDNNFMISINETTVIAFSLTANPIPPSSGLLIELDLDNTPTGIGNIIVSNSSGIEINFIASDLNDDEYSNNCNDEYPDCSANYYDCTDTCGGFTLIDECGVCGGNGASLGYTCDGTPELLEFNTSTLQAFYFFSSATIDGETINQNDWIGAFNGDLCVGARKWSDCGGETCEVPVMGNDGTQLTQGYMQSGEIPTFKLFSAEELEYYNATPSENYTWSNLGMNIIDSLSTITTSSYCLELHTGANLKSFYAIPSDNSIPFVFNQLGDNAIGVITEGGACSQITTDFWVGSQCNLNPTKGYWIILEDNDNLCINDGIITDPSTIYNLHVGANLISFPSSGSIYIEDALPENIISSVAGTITEGGACTQLTPGFWIGSQCNFISGSGYWLISNSNISFSFDLSELIVQRNKSNDQIISNLQGWNVNQSMNQAFYFINEISINNRLVNDGWVLVYHQDVLIGAQQWNGTIIDVPAMGDDEYSYSDGYAQYGDNLNFIYINEHNQSTPLYTDIPITWENNTIVHLGEVKGSTILPEKISINAYPNPFNPMTNLNFSIPIEGVVDISIYNLNGQKLEQIENEFKNSGSYNYIWDASIYPSGVYFAYLNINQTVYTQKLILLK